MIRFSHVYKEYPRTGHALSDVNFHIRKGEFCFLTGHSGAGKSTMLRLIHMAERPSRGEVRVSGYSSASIKQRDEGYQVKLHVHGHNEAVGGQTLASV